MSCGSPFRARIEQVANQRRPSLPLFRYTVLDEETGTVVFDGVAADMREAVDSVNAWLEFQQNSAAA
ncbi:MAG: hypothetical protein JO041_07970 [Acidobacteria bacterium]|nr:hypothetical protein [Acidobacteriota bacterium]